MYCRGKDSDTAARELIAWARPQGIKVDFELRREYGVDVMYVLRWRAEKARRSGACASGGSVAAWRAHSWYLAAPDESLPTSWSCGICACCSGRNCACCSSRTLAKVLRTSVAELFVYLNDESKIDFTTGSLLWLTIWSVTEPWRAFKSLEESRLSRDYTEFQHDYFPQRFTVDS